MEIIALYLILTVFVVYIGVVRNMRVLDYRITARHKLYGPPYIFTQEREDLIAEFESVPYSQMVYKFWKSFDSFYSKEVLIITKGRNVH